MPQGMLLSSYLCDLVMAGEYVLMVRKVSFAGMIPIAITKLLGDAFAWLAYAHESAVVLAVGIAVLLLNLFYIACCMEEPMRRKLEAGA